MSRPLSALLVLSLASIGGGAGCASDPEPSDPCAGVSCAPGRACVAGRCVDRSPPSDAAIDATGDAGSDARVDAQQTPDAPLANLLPTADLAPTPDSAPTPDLGCQPACSAAFSCKAGRCERTYDAYSGAGGGLCAPHPFLASSVWCEAGDLCLGVSVGRCRAYEFPQKGDTYTPYSGSDLGAQCSPHNSRCQPGDLCLDAQKAICERTQ